MGCFTYLNTVLFGFENIFCIGVHISFLAYLAYSLRKETAFIPLLFSSQIPFIMFPFFRFFWTIHMYSLLDFLIFNMLFLTYFIHKSVKMLEGKPNWLSIKQSLWNVSKDFFSVIKAQIYSFPQFSRPFKNTHFSAINFFLVFFILTLFFSLIGSNYFEVRFFSVSYASSWFLTFFLALNLMRKNRRLLLLSFHNFLLASFFMIATGIILYISKYGFPVSFDEIYQNKLYFTYNPLLTLHLFGNIHNIVPFLYFINILSFSMLLCFFNKRKETTECSYLIEIKSISTYWVLWLNFMGSFILLSLLIARGALISALVFYGLSSYFLTKTSKKGKGFFLLLIFSSFNFILSPRIQGYFIDIFGSFAEILSALFGTHTDPGSLSDTSVYERLEAFKIGIQIIQDNLLFGVGIDNYSYLETTYTSPHNLIIQHVAETGILGLFFIFSLVLYIGKQLLYQKNKFLFILIVSLAAFLLYMTMFGGQFVHTGMLINGLILFYILFLYSRLNQRDFIDNEELSVSEKSAIYQLY